ncbi:hypothetical protein HDU97_002500 [Phlyctochytrium planicorne]|nr:hypothetical protein HDU97_002500 [Phlyctochytrium planicorne]
MSSYPRESFAPTEATASEVEYGAPARATTATSNATSSARPYSDVQVIPATAASSSSGNQQNSSSAASPLSSGGSKRQFWTRRRRIFCFVCLGLIFVLAAILIPVMIYVILPNAVQGNLNRSRFVFQDAKFTDLGSDKVKFDLTMTLEDAGALPLDISFESPLTIVYEDKTILSLPPPGNKVYVRNGPAKISESFDATIKDQAGWKSFSEKLITNRDFTWFVSADVKVVVFSPITVAATLTNRPLGTLAFDNFKNGDTTGLTPQLVKFDLPGPNMSPFTGLNVSLTTKIYNPTAINIPFGAAQFAILLKQNSDGPEQEIGKLYAPSLTFVPGYNEFNMIGAFAPIAKDAKDVQQRVSRLFNAFLQSQNQVLKYLGLEQGTIGTNDKIAYLDSAVKKMVLEDVPFKGSSEQTLINKLTIGNQGSLDLTRSTDGKSAQITIPTVGGTFSIPFEFKYSLKTFTYNTTLVYNGKDVATLITGPITTNGTSGARAEKRPFVTSFNDFKLDILDTQREGFNTWLGDLVNAPGPVSAALAGVSTIGIETEIGDLNLTSLPVPKGPEAGAFAFQGLNGLRTNARIVNMNFAAGNQGALTWSFGIALTNPSTVSLNLGDIRLKMNYGTVNLGNVSIPAVNLPAGASTSFTNATVIYSPAPADTAASNDFLSKFINNGVIATSVQGFNGSSVIPAVDAAVARVDVAGLNVTTNTVSLFPNTAQALNLDTLFTALTTTRLTLNNPFPTAIGVNSFNGNFTWNDGANPYVLGNFDTVGPLAGNFSATSVAGGSNQIVTVQTNLTLSGNQGPLFIKYALEARRATTTPVLLQSSINLNIGSDSVQGARPGFPAIIQYRIPSTGAIL